jgi:hydrogenase large subunit
MGERVQLLGLVAEFQTFLEGALFGVALDDILALENVGELDAFAAGPGRASDFAAFLRIAADLRLEAAGCGPGPLMSFGAYHGVAGPLFARGLRAGDEVLPVDAAAIGEDVAHSWMRESAAHPFEAETIPAAQKPGAYSWAKAPRYCGKAAEVGAFARQAVDGHPLILDLLRCDGASTVRGRVVARMIEVAILTHALGGWLRALRLKDAFCHQLEIPPEGRAAGLVEAARGALGHWVVARDGVIARYQIIAPTTWNFSPRDASGRPGPLEGALGGLEVGALGARAPIVQHVVRSFDPCMVCTAH